MLFSSSTLGNRLSGGILPVNLRALLLRNVIDQPRHRCQVERRSIRMFPCLVAMLASPPTPLIATEAGFLVTTRPYVNGPLGRKRSLAGQAARRSRPGLFPGSLEFGISDNGQRRERIPAANDRFQRNGDIRARRRKMIELGFSIGSRMAPEPTWSMSDFHCQAVSRCHGPAVR